MAKVGFDDGKNRSLISSHNPDVGRWGVAMELSVVRKRHHSQFPTVRTSCEILHPVSSNHHSNTLYSPIKGFLRY